MDLQSNKTSRSHVIFQIRNRHTIDPRSYSVADSFYAIVIPLVLLEGFLRLGLTFERIKPAPAGLIVNTTAPRTGRRVDLDLVAVHAVVLVIFKAVAPDLDAGIHAGFDEKIQLQDEIAVHLFGAKETVRCIEHRGSDDHPVFDGILCFPVALNPAVEGLTVKKFLPLYIGGGR